MKTYRYPLGELKPNQHLIYGANSRSKIKELYGLVRQCKNDEFIIPYTAAIKDIPGIGDATELAKLFAKFYEKFDNILFEESFAKLIEAAL